MAVVAGPMPNENVVYNIDSHYVFVRRCTNRDVWYLEHVYQIPVALIAG